MVEAFYFDGKSATRRPVRMSIEDGKLQILGSDVALQFSLREVNFGEPLANAPRNIELPSGGLCEVSNETEMARMLAGAGVRQSPVVRLQKRWIWTLASFLFILVSSISTYLWGLPEASRILAQKVPQELAQKISNNAFLQLDGKYFRPSRIPPERQNQIRENAISFLSGTDIPPWRLNFRSSRGLGSNAFALPDGNIILLDQLVLQLEEAEINAVLAHELGHLIHRDALRLLIQKGTIAFAVAAWLGDVSSTAVGVSALLLQTGYSREAELEADAFAARLLLRCCQSAEPMITSLTKLERYPGKSGGLLDTHPDVRQRVAAIRAMKP